MQCQLGEECRYPCHNEVLGIVYSELHRTSLSRAEFRKQLLSAFLLYVGYHLYSITTQANKLNSVLFALN